MDLRSIEAKATPGLVAKIQQRFPSFAQEWMDDRTRALAAIYLLKYERPDLLLLHFVDHDAAAHHNGPFTREANAVLEYTDELLGQILAVTSAQAVVALVSDHGFERAEQIVDVNQVLAQEKVSGQVEQRPGFLTTNNDAVARWLRAAAAAKQHGIGREIPKAELLRFAPALTTVTAAFESAAHYLFGVMAQGQVSAKPAEVGVHGLWPGRHDYRSSFILWGKGIKRAHTPELSMPDIAARLAALLGVSLNVNNKAVEAVK